MGGREVVIDLIIEYAKSRGADYGIKKVKGAGDRGRSQAEQYWSSGGYTPASPPGSGPPGESSPSRTTQIIPLAKEFVVKKAWEHAVSYAWYLLEEDYYCPHDDGSTLCSKSKDHRGRHRHKKHGRRRRHYRDTY